MGNKIWVDEVRHTTRGGALCVYKTNGVMPDKAGTKKQITKFSDSSRKKLAFVASNADMGWLSMITLTYCRDYPTGGLLVKKHLNHFLTGARRRIKGVKYVWFLEFQKRGAPHIHILLSVPYIDEHQDYLSGLWVNISTTESVKEDFKYMRHVVWFNSRRRKSKYGGCQFWQSAKTDTGLSHYAVKYSTKMEQKDARGYAEVGRFWGASRGLVIYNSVSTYGEFAKQPDVKKLFPAKKLLSLPKYIFGD